MLVRNSIDRNKTDTISKLVQFPEDLGPHGMLLVFREYEYETPGSRGLLEFDLTEQISIKNYSSILLPIPQNLQEQSDTRLNRADLRLIAEGFTSAADAAAESSGDVGSMVKDAMKTIYGTVDGGAAYNSWMSGNMHDASGTAGYLLKRLNSTAGAVLSIGDGNLANPKAALAFDGVELKNHNFSWQFAPRSEAETRILHNVIKTIKSKQLPSYGGALARNLYLRYPNTVDIYLIGVIADHFVKYKTSMIRTFNVNYGPNNGVALLKGGTPASVSIELNLTEMDIHTREDYETSLTSFVTPVSGPQ